MLPNLPTDNLYKFISLSGVFVFCFGLYFTNIKIDDLNERIYKEDLKIAEWTVNADWLKREIDEIERIQLNSIANQKGEFEYSESKLHLMVSDAEFKIRWADIKDKSQKQQLELARIQEGRKYTNKLVSKVNRYSKAGNWIMIVSILISAFGFFLWYVRVQKPLDAVVGDDNA